MPLLSLANITLSSARPLVLAPKRDGGREGEGRALRALFPAAGSAEAREHRSSRARPGQSFSIALCLDLLRVHCRRRCQSRGGAALLAVSQHRRAYTTKAQEERRGEAWELPWPCSSSSEPQTPPRTPRCQACSGRASYLLPFRVGGTVRRPRATKCASSKRFHGRRADQGSHCHVPRGSGCWCW